MPKHLTSDMQGGWKSPEESRSRSKVRDIDDGWFQQMVLERETRFFIEARKKGDLPEMEKICKRLGWTLRDKDKINCK